MGDCTNGGVSSRYHALILVGKDVPGLFETFRDKEVTSSIGLSLGVSALFTLLAAFFALPLPQVRAIIKEVDIPGKVG